jgi:hypothetical protein
VRTYVKVQMLLELTADAGLNDFSLNSTEPGLSPRSSVIASLEHKIALSLSLSPPRAPNNPHT